MKYRFEKRRDARIERKLRTQRLRTRDAFDAKWSLKFGSWQVHHRVHLLLGCYTQGLADDGCADGSFETIWLKPLSCSDALNIVRALPVPPPCPEPCSVCPPTFGVGERFNVCRTEGGKWFWWTPWTGSTECSAKDADDCVKSFFRALP